MMGIISSIIGTLCFLGLILFMYFTMPSPVWFAIMIAPTLWWVYALPIFIHNKKESNEATKILREKKQNPTLPKSDIKDGSES